MVYTGMKQYVILPWQVLCSSCANRKYVKREMNNKNASNAFIIVNKHVLYSNTQYNLLNATGQLDHLQSYVERAQANLICPRMLHLFLCF